MPLQLSGMVAQPMSQQNNGHPSNPPTPQSQTPTTSGMHGGPSTPGPQHGMVTQSQTPSPAQPVMFTGPQSIPHSGAGGFNNQNMVLMQGPPNTGHPSHQNQGQPGVIQGHMPVIQQSPTLVIPQQHYQVQQNQPTR